MIFKWVREANERAGATEHERTNTHKNEKKKCNWRTIQKWNRNGTSKPHIVHCSLEYKSKQNICEKRHTHTASDTERDREEESDIPTYSTTSSFNFNVLWNVILFYSPRIYFHLASSYSGSSYMLCMCECVRCAPLLTSQFKCKSV